MSFKATLVMEVEGSSITPLEPEDGVKVLNCSFNFTKPIDLSTGYTHGKVQAGLIRMTIESTKSVEYLRWIISNGRGKGQITFWTIAGHGAEVIDKKLIFEESYLVEYGETFDSNDTRPMDTHLEFFAKKITINDVSYNSEGKDVGEEEGAWEETDSHEHQS